VCKDLVVGRRLDATTTFHSAHAICAMTVRSEFDDYCLQRTIERGAEFRTIPHIQGIAEDADQVILDTKYETFSADYLIGADGANGVVRRLVPGLDTVTRGFAIEAQVPMHAPPPMEVDFGVVEFGYGWLFPKGDHVNVGLYTNQSTVRLTRSALADYARAKLGTTDIEHVVGHHVGLKGWDGRLATRRVVLAGDAAGLVDPLLGEGIHNAVASGQSAAAAIEKSRTNGRNLRVVYARELRPILRDLRSSDHDAERFYRQIEIGYRVLTSRVVHSALMTGYARGLTFSATKRWFFLLPLFPLAPAERVLPRAA
jgi:flavin-dependent dehydrogenase